MRDTFLKDKIIKQFFYKNLLDTLKTHERKIKLTPTYYRNKTETMYGFKNELKYSIQNINFFIYLLLFSQNTSDVTTDRMYNTILADSNKNLSDPEYYKAYFYKHKQTYVKSMQVLSSYIQQTLIDNKVLDFKDLVQIRHIGPKSAALLLNHFSEGNMYPVVDSNSIRAFKVLTKNLHYEFLKQIKTPDDLFFILVEYSNLCDDNSGYWIAHLLWAVGKSCLSRSHCGKKFFCKLCDLLRLKLHQKLSAINNVKNF